MQPDSQTPFHQALRLGPGHCPPDLFDGSVPAVVRGLKVHANNISHARHIALEESYPRLVQSMGLEAFHERAERFLDQPRVLSRSLDRLGKGLEGLLDDPAHRDLARSEWLWLEAFQAAEADALTLTELAALEPEVLLATRLRLHPASRWFELESADQFVWAPPIAASGGFVLLSRPEAEVFVRRVDSESASILSQISKSCLIEHLLGTKLPPLIALIDAGAIILENDHED